MEKDILNCIDKLKAEHNKSNIFDVVGDPKLGKLTINQDATAVYSYKYIVSGVTIATTNVEYDFNDKKELNNFVKKFSNCELEPEIKIKTKTKIKDYDR